MSNQLEYRHIRYFLAVAQELHFRKAAEKLFISQPALSRQIKEMELILGYPVLERHNRKVALTPAGALLKTEFTQHLDSLKHSIDRAKQLHDGNIGELKLGYVGSAMQKIIPDLLTTYKLTNPDLLFTLKEMENQNQIDALLAFEIDVGFVRLDKVPEEIERWRVLHETFCLVLPTEHKMTQRKFRNINQVKEASFILFDPAYSPSYYEKVIQIFSDSGYVPKVSHNTINASTIYKLVEKGFGLSIVPHSLKSMGHTSVKFIDLDNIPQRTQLSAIWNKNNKKASLKQFQEEIMKLNKSQRL